MASQWPPAWLRYSTTLLVAPYLRSAAHHIVERLQIVLVVSTSQVGKVCHSWPVFACASAAMVIRFLKPTEVMKSACTSTLFLSDQTATCLRITSLPAGTQWSQNPIETRPAAPAVRICTSGKADAAAPSLSALRRVTFPLRILDPFPNTAGSSSGPPAKIAGFPAALQLPRFR